jgi:hypothetical protein
LWAWEPALAWQSCGIVSSSRDGPQRARTQQASAPLQVRPVTCRWPQEDTAMEIAKKDFTSITGGRAHSLQPRPSPAARPNAHARAQARTHADQKQACAQTRAAQLRSAFPRASRKCARTRGGLWSSQRGLAVPVDAESAAVAVAPCHGVACCALHVACMLHLCF